MSEVIWLSKHELNFPDPNSAFDEPDGLLAAGGDLSAARLMRAYQQGVFPWYEEGQPILWWSPNPRAVLFPEKLTISRSLKKILRQNNFSVTADHAFQSVINACAEPRPYSEDTWITDEMIVAYCRLHQMGLAHSVEVWSNHQLVGGLYGIAMGQLFFGESMFSRQSNASKVAFVYLVKQLQQWGYQLIDCQLPNQHLVQFGVEHVSRKKFLQYLEYYQSTELEKASWVLDMEAINTSL